MLNFCTLFNTNYLARGLVMYDSLKLYCKSFHLYVFAFDDKTFEYLTQLKLEHLTVISLHDFEDEKLLEIKATRSAAEYCWTCTPSTIFYCIHKFNLDHCTYIDADLLFYSDPIVLIKEMGDKSILLSEHRYTAARDLSALSGRYCVQFICFKSDVNGLEALQWWREACIEWCYARHENGKFGDQKYLDDWTERFKSVHVLEHLGGGLAPWNIQQYEFELRGDTIKGTEKATGFSFEAVFYHFHGVRFYRHSMVSLADSGYVLNSKIKRLFYKPYVSLLLKKAKQISKDQPDINANGVNGDAPKTPLNLTWLVKFYWYEIKKSPLKIFFPDIKWWIQNHHIHKV